MTTTKIPLRCKLEVKGSITQQEMRFKYLEIELPGYGDVDAEVREQTTRATKIAGCLNATIWRNKNIGLEAKSRIYKTAIRPIMTCTAETRPETTKTKRLLETTEIKVLRGIAGKTLLDRKTSENIRTCRIEKDPEKDDAIILALMEVDEVVIGDTPRTKMEEEEEEEEEED